MIEIILFYFLAFFFSAYCFEIKEDNRNIYKCGANYINQEPILFSGINHNKESNYRDIKSFNNKNNTFKDFHIHLDLYNFNEEIKQNNLTHLKDFFADGMKKAKDTLEYLLKVKDNELYGKAMFSDLNLTNIGIYYWDKTKIGDELLEKNITMKSLGIDLYIFAKVGNKTEMGNKTLAWATANILDSYTLQPFIGTVTINKDVDYSKINSKRYLESILIHEFTHVLGFSNYFSDHFHNYYQEYDNDGILRAYLNSSKVVETAKKYFNCDNIKGVPLEEYGRNGTYGSHWEERALLGDYMCGVVFNEEQAISEFTLALLEDLGYYKANYYTGGLMQFGKNKGCDFLYSKCVINGTVNPKFKNEFFDNIFYGNYEPGCSSGRQSRVYHYLLKYSTIEIPKQYQYYPEENVGGRFSTNFCPIFEEDYKEM